MPPQTSPSNQFDFINSSGQSPKKPSLNLPAGNSQTQRIMIFVGILGIVIVFLLFIMVMTSRGGEDKALFVGIVQRQSELARVAALGAAEQSANTDVKNTSSTINLTISSDKQSFVTALAKKKIKLKGKDLNGVPNAATTKLLTDAKAAANFDSTLISTLSDQLEDYQSSLEAAYGQTKSKSLKENLSQASQHTDLLQKQLEATKP